MRKRQKCHFIRVGHCLMTMTTVWGSTSYAIFQRLMTMFQRLGETLLRTKRRMLRFERCCSDTNRPDRSSASPRRWERSQQVYAAFSH